MLSTESDSTDIDRRGADKKKALDEIFLNELKLQFENLLRLKEGLENRANNLVAASATIATLLFGFTAFSYANIESNNQYFCWTFFPLSVSVGASITAMSFALYASRLALFSLPLGHQPFFKADGSMDTDNVNEYRDSTEVMFFDIMIETYLDSMKMNTEQYYNKAKWMKLAQIFFLSKSSCSASTFIFRSAWDSIENLQIRLFA